MASLVYVWVVWESEDGTPVCTPHIFASSFGWLLYPRDYPLMPKARLQHFARIKDSDFVMGPIDYIAYLGFDTLHKIPSNPENQGGRTN